mgnify:CR=1 FL=1
MFVFGVSIALAQSAPIPDSLRNALNRLVNPLIGILVGIALLVFFWGIFEMVSNAGNEEARTTGKRHIIWGLVGFLIIFGVVGIINIIKSLFENSVIGPLG